MARSTSMTREEILASPGAANSALGDLAAASKSDLPVAQYPPDDLVTLPGGFMHKGELLRRVVVRELTGEHEDALAKALNNPNPYHFLLTLLTSGVDHIGELDHKESVRLLPRMLVGDWDEIVLGIRVATYGETMEVFGWICPACARTVDKLAFSLIEDVDRTKLKDPANDTVFEIELRKGARAKVHLCTGEVLLAVHDVPDLTTPQRNDVMLSKCIETYTDPQGQTHMIAGFPSLVRSMSAPDRQTILRELNTRQPGPRYNGISFKHDECGNEVTLALGITDLFRDLISGLV